jgi:hypothetical protein
MAAQTGRKAFKRGETGEGSGRSAICKGRISGVDLGVKEGGVGMERGYSD